MRRILAAAFLSLVLTGCSSFHKEWKTSLSRPIPAGDMSGPWEGRWESEKNGHHGRLRCVMAQTGTNAYTAHFHAVFWKLFRAAYQVPFTVTKEGDQFRFSGQSDLGSLGGGVYTYEGIATPGDFKSSYRSKYDHGWFNMTRPSPQNPSQ